MGGHSGPGPTWTRATATHGHQTICGAFSCWVCWRDGWSGGVECVFGGDIDLVCKIVDVVVALVDLTWCHQLEMNLICSLGSIL